MAPTAAVPVERYEPERIGINAILLGPPGSGKGTQVGVASYIMCFVIWTLHALKINTTCAQSAGLYFYILSNIVISQINGLLHKFVWHTSTYLFAYSHGTYVQAYVDMWHGRRPRYQMWHVQKSADHEMMHIK